MFRVLFRQQSWLLQHRGIESKRLKTDSQKGLCMAVKVGFIGTGGISQAHRRHLKKMEDVEVVAMCDLVEEKVQVL